MIDRTLLAVTLCCLVLTIVVQVADAIGRWRYQRQRGRTLAKLDEIFVDTRAELQALTADHRRQLADLVRRAVGPN